MVQSADFALRNGFDDVSYSTCAAIQVATLGDSVMKVNIGPGMCKTLAVGLVLFAAASAHADLVGLRVFRETAGGGPPPPGAERWVYRVYAEFTDPGDRVFFWGASSSLGTATIVNITSAGLPGSGFTNVPDDSSGNRAPDQPFSARDWDTYMTIGVRYGAQGPGGFDYTVIGGATPTFIANGSSVWTTNQGGAGLSDITALQGTAGYWIQGNDTDRRVLLMQLVVNAGEHVAGTVGIWWKSGIDSTLMPNLTFNSVPCPSCMTILMPFISATLRSRRRRR
jgi:hypothetical protein